MIEVCDARIAWVLAGCRDRWGAEMRSIAVSLPPDYCAKAAGRTARALTFENEQARQFRAKKEFQSLPNR